MTRKQEYLAYDLTDEEVEICKKDAEKMQREMPWTQEDTDRHADYTGYTSWLDLILDQARRNAERIRGQYCAEMGVD